MYSAVGWTSAGNTWFTVLWNNADGDSGQEPPDSIWWLDNDFACWCQINWCALSKLLVKLFICHWGEKMTWRLPGVCDLQLPLLAPTRQTYSWSSLLQLLFPKLVLCVNTVELKTWALRLEYKGQGCGPITYQFRVLAQSVWIFSLSFLICKWLSK